MTTQEAIKQLQTEHDLIATERDLDGSQFAPALLEALAMAIEVLKCSEIPNGSGKDTNVPSKDCIDRAEAQTAIQFAARRYTVAHEAHGEGHVVWSDNLISVTDAMNALREVPSAQPEPQRTFVELVVEYPDPELCTYKEYKGKPYYSIKYIENGETYVGYGTYNPKVLSRYLSEYFISPAHPEQKTGKWIPVHPLQSDDCGAYMCSKCKTGMWEIRPSVYHYCPNCGKPMKRGEQDG